MVLSQPVANIIDNIKKLKETSKTLTRKTKQLAPKLQISPTQILYMYDNPIRDINGFIIPAAKIDYIPVSLKPQSLSLNTRG